MSCFCSIFLCLLSVISSADNFNEICRCFTTHSQSWCPFPWWQWFKPKIRVEGETPEWVFYLDSGPIALCWHSFPAVDHFMLKRWWYICKVYKGLSGNKDFLCTLIACSIFEILSEQKNKSNISNLVVLQSCSCLQLLGNIFSIHHKSAEI